jgi:pilus assembly protein CpaE
MDIDVAVVDTDPLWRVRYADAVEPHPAGQFERLDHAVGALAPGRPAVLLVGPGLAADHIDELGALERSRPELLEVIVVPDLSVPVLQSAMRAGVYDVLGTDAAVDAVAGSVAKALAELHVAEAHADVHERCHPGRLVVVTGAKSGEGASSIAVNLATALAADGTRSVALIEGDARFGDVALMLGLPPAPLDDGAAAAGVDTDRQSVLSMLTPHEPTQLGVLVPPRTTVPIDDNVKQQTVAVISGVQALADVVVLDAPFHLVEAADLLAYADEVVFVTDADLASIKNTMVALGVLDRAGGLREQIRLVLNKVGPDDKPDLAAIERHVGSKVDLILPASAPLAASLDAGVPLLLSAPDDPFARQVKDLATKVAAGR